MAEASEKRPLRLAVLISGTGRTLKNLLDRIQAKQLNAKVVLVVASTPSAKGLQYAEINSIPIRVLERSAFNSKEEYSQEMFHACREAKVDYAVMAGFIKLIVIPPDFENRVLNIHPSLVPSFCGKGFYGHHVHEAALKYGVKISGCTVHIVDNQYDHGPVVLQKAVPVLEDDTPDSLNDRVFEAEREAYPEAIQLLADDRIKVDDRLVRILPPPEPEAEDVDSPDEW